MIRNHILWMMLLIGAANQAWAQLTIEITRGKDDPLAIAVVPFGGKVPGGSQEDIAAIVAADLQRTGQFQAVDREDMLSMPTSSSNVYYRDWRALNVNYLLIGNLKLTAEGVMAYYQLFDVYNQEMVLSSRIGGRSDQLRGIAHGISDAVYGKLTGIRGAFSTKLLYVSAVKRSSGQYSYRLLKSDVDGEGEEVLFASNDPIVSPSWAPDGKRIAYVSFETSRPAIFMHDLVSGQRTQLTDFKGLNGSPVWSPDGKQLAMVLSKDGSPDIYVMDVASRRLKRVTRHFAIDTEPSWLPNGKSLVFTSDRGGKPQIYRADLVTGIAQRLTYEGDYNARARVAPDGAIIMVHRSVDRRYHIARQDLSRDGKLQILTETDLDESPTISPNGAMLLYATKHQGKGILAAVSLDGGVKFRLPSQFGDVREPAWSPFLN